MKKIHFKLHESYANPNRILTKAPYEVNESGWGEFEIVIKIFFIDPTERPVTIYHILKLFQSPISIDANNTEGQQNSIVSAPPASIVDTKKFLVSEYYDEIVFQEPTQLMQQLLNNVQPISSGSWSHETDCKFSQKFKHRWSIFS